MTNTAPCTIRQWSEKGTFAAQFLDGRKITKASIRGQTVSAVEVTHLDGKPLVYGARAQ